MKRLIDEDETDQPLDSDEELANEQVDSLLAPRNLNTIDEMIRFNDERNQLIKQALEHIKQTKGSQKQAFAYRTVSNDRLPDSS